MVELSWSQTPSSVWWALETGTAASNLSLDNILSPPTPNKLAAGSGSRKRTLQHQLTNPTIFYNSIDETDSGERDEDLEHWVSEDPSRGIIRVYQPGFSYSEVVKCTINTTAETIMGKCLARELFIHYGGKWIRRVRMDEHPLQLFYRFLREIGHTSARRMQLIGMKEDLAPLFKFVGGQEIGNRPEDKAQLAHPLRVKEMNGGMGVPTWSKRFTVLCGSRMFVFPGSRPKGKPNLVLDLRGGRIEEHKSKKYFYCLKVTASYREVRLAFETGMEQSKWLERAAKVLSRHPLEANLAGLSLETLPKYYFLNYNLVAMNLAHNYMAESFFGSDAAMLGQPRTLGWITDLHLFRHLVSLSLSDNCLEQFPLSLCGLKTLQELDISSNNLKSVPQEIQNLTNLTTLLLHSNQLSDLPYNVNQLRQLSTLVLAFNRFFELPQVVKELPSLKILIASGNHISAIPEDLHRIETLHHFDVRLNRLRHSLPDVMEELPDLARLNVSGNGLSEINTDHVKHLQQLNCSDNSLKVLSVVEGRLKELTARNNKIVKLTVAPSCPDLTTIDISKNELTSLPASITRLPNLERLNASRNYLTELPAGIFQMGKLKELVVSENRLVSLPQNISPNCPLQQLDLHSNQLTTLPSDLLAHTSKLRVLNVTSNQLSNLPIFLRTSDDSYGLTELYAANNSFIFNVLVTIAGYHRLKVLHLAYNQIRGIPTGFFSHMKRLEYVNFSSNSLSTFPPIMGSPRLRCLLLHSNELSSLPAMPTLPHLHTLDLACNHFENVPDISSFPRLEFLDLSGNTKLTISKASIKILKGVSHCSLEGIADIRGEIDSKGTFIETGGSTAHGRWSYGSTQVIGIDTRIDCTVQLKTPSLGSRPSDGLFAILDGGRSTDAPASVRKNLETTLLEELTDEERMVKQGVAIKEKLQYLTHTFLSAHRQLGSIGQKYGCSAVVCHIMAIPQGGYSLNVANTGLGEAILCRSARPVPLTTPHSPATSVQERVRIAESRGFVSRDHRVNGVSSVSRLLGCYHLWPQVIPAPSTESVELRPEDSCIVIATDGLWKHLPYEQVVHQVQLTSDPIQASKRLRDLAIAQGCQTDISVVVVKLDIGSAVPAQPERKMKYQKTIVEPEESEDEEEDAAITNIDDVITDSEEEGEEGERMDDGEQTPIQDGEGGAVDALGLAEDMNENSELDQLVLSAVHSPTTSPYKPRMHSTNFDDIIMEEDDPYLDPSIPIPSTATGRGRGGGGEGGIPTSTQSDLPYHATNHVPVVVMPEMEYEAQTLPMTTKQRKSGQEVPVNGGVAILAETSFEQTQSVPTIKVNGVHRDHQVQLRAKQPKAQLAALNQALSQIEEDENGGSMPYAPSYPVESIERPRRRVLGAKVAKRLSYVERSYNRLTNDMYSENSLVGPSEYTTTDLNKWADA